MSAPNLQNICLEQYINSVQNTENDPIYSKLFEQEEEINDRFEAFKNNTIEYRNLENTRKILEKAEADFEKAEEIYNKVYENLCDKKNKELEAVRNAAIAERKNMMERVDPNFERFNQCAECKNIVMRDKVGNCWMQDCEANQNYCVDCFGYSEGGFERKCQYCCAPACCNDHHYEHVKKCVEYWKTNICGYEPDYGSEGDVGFLDDYFDWSEKNWKNKPTDSWILFTGRINREGQFCNKKTPNVQQCLYCGYSFCPNCAHKNGYCHSEECVKEERGEFLDYWS